MSVTVDGIHCGTKKIVRGSPQGSVLGYLLYCVTTQSLTRREANPSEQSPTTPTTPPRMDVGPFHSLPGLPGAAARTRMRFFPGSESDESEGVNFWDSDDQLCPDLTRGLFDPVLGDDGIITFKYIDDTTAFEAVPMAAAIRHLLSGPTTEVLHPAGLESTLVDIAGRADEIGMRVNVKKTQLLCISPNNGCITSAYVKANGDYVWSSPAMKLVGFTFSGSPTAEAHVLSIREEYCRKVWFLFHLRESGIKGINLYKLYCRYLCLRIEYLSAAYHSMLLKGQAESLERLHRYALRVCFGFAGDIRETLAELSIATLQERRVRRTDAFIAKAARNPRFRHWFPLRLEGGMELRNRRRIEETRCKTQRRFNGPLVHLKRPANELGITAL